MYMYRYCTCTYTYVHVYLCMCLYYPPIFISALFNHEQEAMEKIRRETASILDNALLQRGITKVTYCTCTCTCTMYIPYAVHVHCIHVRTWNYTCIVHYIAKEVEKLLSHPDIYKGNTAIWSNKECENPIPDKQKAWSRTCTCVPVHDCVLTLYMYILKYNIYCTMHV